MMLSGKTTSKEKDFITNKILAVFVLCFVALGGLIWLGHTLSILSTWNTGIAIAGYLTWVCIGILAGAIFRLRYEKKNHIDCRFRLMKGKYMGMVGAYGAWMFWLIKFFGLPALQVFQVLLPATAIFYLIYHTYPREFFFFALDASVSAGLLWLVRRLAESTHFQKYGYAVCALGVVLALAQLWYIQKRKHHKVHTLIDGKKTELFSAKHAFCVLYTGGLLLIVLPLLGALFGVQVAFYLMFASLGALLISAVYYTVKML